MERRTISKGEIFQKNSKEGRLETTERPT